jgi:hypothetical protein
MYRAGAPGNFWPKVAGFLLLPTVGAIATRLAAPVADGVASSVMGKQANPMHVAATIGALAQAGLAYYCYVASEGSAPIGTQAFLRGGMWGAMLSASAVAATPFVFEGSPMPAVSGAQNPLVDKAFGLLTAQAAGAVAAKRLGQARGMLR